MNESEDSVRFDYYPDGQARRIDRSMFCDNCGYNLRTLPAVGKCTECGNPYNARGIRLKGILIPQSVRFPSSDLFLFIIVVAIAAYMFYSFYTLHSRFALVLAGVFAAIGAIQSWFLCRDVGKYVHCRRLVRQIRAQREG